MQAKRDSQEFYHLIARLLDNKPNTVQRYWRGVFEVIVRELYTTGVVYLPQIGYLTLKEYPRQVQKQVTADGEVHYYEVPARDRPIFTPDDEFIDDINMEGVTKSYRKRQQLGKPTLRDQERERRAREILGLDYDDGKRGIRRKEQMAAEFGDMLEQLRQDYEEKVQQNLKETADE